MKEFSVKGYIVDLFNSSIRKGEMVVADGTIHHFNFDVDDVPKQYILPGLVDAHIHIESSMLPPTEFARLAVSHGTVASVSDPHEIANILGMEGIEYMIDNAALTPLKVMFGAPSCVPSISFDESGSRLDVADIEKLLRRREVGYLSEVMDVPAVLNDDADMDGKLNAAKRNNKPIDGHAPALSGDGLKKYIAKGISTDHECFTLAEAQEKVNLGMKILMREGSAAQNLETLLPILRSNPDKVMVCSDDRHPDSLINAHIDSLIRTMIQKGYDFFDVLRTATVNPVEHYNLNVGLLRTGDPADFIIVDDLKNFNVLQTFIDGTKVAENGTSLLPHQEVKTINHFNATPVSPDDFLVETTKKKIRVIGVIDGELVTQSLLEEPKTVDNKIVADIERDILKIAVINRYNSKKMAVGFIKNFGLKRGALASSVAHDNHNIVAVGCDDESLAQAVNIIIKHKGGISISNGKDVDILPLPIAGLMSDDDGYKVARSYQDLLKKATALGSTLHQPFMTLAFMSLLVIPELKISDKGLFDYSSFSFTSLS